ncbi:MAG: hypothetical protein ACOYNY_33810 [Caldilineaceae bacterium]
MKRMALQLGAIMFAVVAVVSLVLLTIQRKEQFPALATAAPTVIITHSIEPRSLGGDKNLAPPQSLSEKMLNTSRQSVVASLYPDVAGKFIYALVEHLADFQLPDLGVTEQAMNAALQQGDAGTRINSLVNEVWADWTTITQEKNLDLWTTEPNDYGLSPFRQLTIKLIQGRQGQLADSQQHALHNFFTRPEEQTVWEQGIDGVIGAVNRESFRWP